jgi:hypothetical protein
MLIGAAPETNRISAFWRIFDDRAIGLFCTSHAFTWRCKYQRWQLDNVLAAGQLHQDCDRLYIPPLAHTTGDIDIDDVAVDSSGQVIFISTLLNCIATVANLSGNQVLSHNVWVETAVTSTVWQW